jgi:hypothetical protein
MITLSSLMGTRSLNTMISLIQRSSKATPFFTATTSLVVNSGDMLSPELLVTY